MHLTHPGHRPDPVRPTWAGVQERTETARLAGGWTLVVTLLLTALCAGPAGADDQDGAAAEPTIATEQTVSSTKPASVPLPAALANVPSPVVTAVAPTGVSAEIQDAAVRPDRIVPSGDEGKEFETLRSEFNTTVREATLARLNRYLATFRDPKAIKRIQGRLQRLVESDPDYLRFVATDALERLTKGHETPLESQYFLYVDRNPTKQTITVAFYDAQAKRVDLLGQDLVSSGDIRKGNDYFETPTGVFEHVVDNFGYRALGTPNAEGWRGLGEKDSRVWDFGYQPGMKTYKNGTTLSQMRLLLHATDPVGGEERLGRVDSKGCIRISKGLNYFLDVHGILDQQYEEWAKSKPSNWLLRKGRQPVSLPGRFLVIGDSSQIPDLHAANVAQPDQSR